MASICSSSSIKSQTASRDIFPNTPSSLSQFHRKFTDFPPVSKTLTPVKKIDVQYEHPDVKSIEKRTVNKELETRRIIINIIILLVSNLVYKFLALFLNQFEFASSVESQFEAVYYTEKSLTILKLLVIYNIGSGIYQLFKRPDEFKDLKLSSHQRQLLGLPLVPTTTIQPATTSSLNKYPESSLEPAQSDASLFSTPVKSIQTSFVKDAKPTATTASIFQKNNISNKSSSTAELIKKQKSLVASPMSSPKIQRFAPSNPNPLTSSSSDSSTANTSFINKLNAASLARQPLDVSTPSYIPSPKYYYRMDSPSRTRRRV